MKKLPAFGFCDQCAKERENKISRIEELAKKLGYRIRKIGPGNYNILDSEGKEQCIEKRRFTSEEVEKFLNSLSGLMEENNKISRAEEDSEQKLGFRKLLEKMENK